MVEYCEIFKMAFSKIQDFLRRPKALKLLQDISYDFSYPIFNFADTLTTVVANTEPFLLPEPTTATESIFLLFEEKEKFDTVGLSTMWFVLIVLFLMTVKIEQILWCL